MSLEEAFYILGIVVMSFTLIILVVIVTSLLVIRSKIAHIQRAIEEKLSIANTAADVARKVIKKK